MDIQNRFNGGDDSCSRDLACKSFFSLNERFADLLNGGFYYGQQRILAHELREVDTELGVQVKGSSVWRRRDLMKGHCKGDSMDLVGVEFQSTVDMIMPLRTMVYDALTYQKAYDLYNRICPVMTMCLYTGDRKWNGPRTLHKMKGIDCEKSEYVPDYPVYVVDLKEVDVQWFHNDEVRQLVQLFQLLNQTKDVEMCVIKLKEMKITSEDAVRTAGILAGSDLYNRLLTETEGGNFVACQNIERIYNEIAEKKYPDLVEARKRAEEGKRQAEEGKRQAEEGKRQAEEGKRQAEEEISELKSKANTTARNLLQMGISAQMVSKATGMSEIEVLALMDA